VAVHKAFMISAFVVSSVFWFPTSFTTTVSGMSRFRAGLGSSVLFCFADVSYFAGDCYCANDFGYLAAAWLEKFDRHRVIARWTLPLWFYVCVTGVIVYLMVYQIYAPKS